MADEDQQATEDAMARAIAGGVYGIVRLLQDAGMTPQQALRLSAFFIIESALGRDATNSLGMPRTSQTRWRREIASAAESVREAGTMDGPEYELDVLNSVLPVIGLRDLRLVRDEGASDG